MKKKKEKKEQGSKGELVIMPRASKGIEAQGGKSLQPIVDYININDPGLQSFPAPSQLKQEGVVWLPKRLVEGIEGFSYSDTVFKFNQPDMIPTIIEGAIVGVDCSDWELKRGELYMFEAPGCEFRLIRRFINMMGPLGLVFGVDNPEHFDTMFYRKDIKMVGRVKWVINQNIPVQAPDQNPLLDNPFGNIPFLNYRR